MKGKKDCSFLKGQAENVYSKKKMYTVRVGVIITDFVALTGGHFKFFACKSRFLALVRTKRHIKKIRMKGNGHS